MTRDGSLIKMLGKIEEAVTPSTDSLPVNENPRHVSHINVHDRGGVLIIGSIPTVERVKALYVHFKKKSCKRRDVRVDGVRSRSLSWCLP